MLIDESHVLGRGRREPRLNRRLVLRQAVNQILGVFHLAFGGALDVTAPAAFASVLHDLGDHLPLPGARSDLPTILTDRSFHLLCNREFAKCLHYGFTFRGIFRLVSRATNHLRTCANVQFAANLILHGQSAITRRKFSFLFFLQGGVDVACDSRTRVFYPVFSL
jgi:hypothetical protein